MKKITLYLTAFLLSHTLCAGNIYVSSSGNDKNDGSSWNAALKTLPKAVEVSKADDNILLKSGTYTLSSQLNVTKNLKIIGGFTGDETSIVPSNEKPSIIQGNNKFRLVYVKGAELKVSALTFTKGKTLEKESPDFAPDCDACGGAILAYDAPLFIDNCIFKTNSAESAKVSMKNEGASGGAIAVFANSSSMFEVKNSEFTSNSVKSPTAIPAQGGAIYVDDNSGITVAIYNTSFTSNKAESTFPSPYALAQGGAVCVSGGSILNCDFEKNQVVGSTKNDAIARGGAVAVVANQLLQLDSNLFTSNTVKGDNAFGGALYLESGSLNSIEVTQNNFLKNTAEEGGAIATLGKNGKITIDANYFEANSADEGAGIAISNVVDEVLNPVQISNATFYKNKADKGGAIALTDELAGHSKPETTANVLFCTFKENTSKEGSAISVEGTLYASSNIFADSPKALEIYIEADDVTSKATVKNSIVPALTTLPTKVAQDNVKAADPLFAGERTEGAMTSFTVQENSPARDFTKDENTDITHDIFYNERDAQKPTLGSVEYKPNSVVIALTGSIINLVDGDKYTLAIDTLKYTGKPKYQWLVNKNDGKGFVKASSTKDTIAVKASAKVPQSLYKCLVTDETGSSAKSGVFTINVYPKPKITENLAYKGSFKGEDTLLSISATGENLYYQWQVFKDGIWQNIEGENSQNIVLENLQDANVGERYRAQVGVKVDGIILANSFVSSKEAKIKLSQPAEIGGVQVVQKQALFDQTYTAVVPKYEVENLGAGFKTELKLVKVTGAKPKYQWQILVDAQNNTWQDIANATKANYDLTESKEGSVTLRCRVYCELGSQVSEKFTPAIEMDFVMPLIPANLADNALDFNIDGEEFTLVCYDKSSILINELVQQSGSWYESVKTTYKFKTAKDATLKITANQCSYDANGKKQTLKISYDLILTSDGTSRSISGTYTEGKIKTPITSASFEFEKTEDIAVLPNTLEGTNMNFEIADVSYTIIFETAKLYSIITEAGKIVEQGTYSGKKSSNSFPIKLKPSAKNEILSIAEFNLYGSANKFWTNVKYTDLDGTKFYAEELDSDIRNEYLAPVISDNLPSTLTVESGKSATIEVKAYGTDLKYQWFSNSTPIAKATSNKYTQNFDKAKNNGDTFFVEVTNNLGNVTSQITTVRVIEPLNLKSISADKKACVREDSITLTAVATGEDIFYEWFYSTDGKEWKMFSSGNLNSCSVSPNDIPALHSTDKAYFKVEIYDSLDTEKTNVKSKKLTGSVALVQPSEIQSMLVAQEDFDVRKEIEGSAEETSVEVAEQVDVLQSSKLTLTAVATGYQLKYQWQKLVFEDDDKIGKWTNISGATSKNYTFTPDVNRSWKYIESFYDTYRCKVYSTATQTQAFTKAVELKCELAAMPENPIGATFRLCFTAPSLTMDIGYPWYFEPQENPRRFEFIITPYSKTEAMVSLGFPYWSYYYGIGAVEYITDAKYTYKRTSTKTALLTLTGTFVQVPSDFYEATAKSTPIEISVKISTESNVINDYATEISMEGTLKAYARYGTQSIQNSKGYSHIAIYDKNTPETLPESLSGKSIRLLYLQAFNYSESGTDVTFSDKALKVAINGLLHDGTYTLRKSDGKIIITGNIDYSDGVEITKLTIYPNDVPKGGYPYEIEYTFRGREAKQSGFISNFP